MFAKKLLTKGILLVVFVAVFSLLTPNPASADLAGWWAVDGGSFVADYSAGTISSPAVLDVSDPWLEGWGFGNTSAGINVNDNSFRLSFTLSAAQKVRVRIFQATDPWATYVSKEMQAVAGQNIVRLNCTGITDPAALLIVEHGYAENIGDAVLVSDIALNEIAAIRVTHPDGGETLVPGQVEIAWVADAAITKFNIDLVSGGTPMARLAQGVEGGSFIWNLDASWPAGQAYRVRVKDASASGALDDSNGNFSITGESRIVIERPTSGQIVTRGTSATLRWRYSGISAPTARVVLFKGKVRVATLAKSAPLGADGIGLFVWTPDADLVAGTDYHIRVVAGKKAGRGPAFKIE